MSPSMLPVSMMSEEAQEARNKANKSFREKHARKTSQIDNISDVFHRLMVTSDNVVSSSSVREQHSEPLPHEVKNMLKDPFLQLNDSDTSDNEES